MWIMLAPYTASTTGARRPVRLQHVNATAGATRSRPALQASMDGSASASKSLGCQRQPEVRR